MKSKKGLVKKLLGVLLALCVLLVPVSAFAGVNYIDKISVAYTNINYKSGDAPQATARVTEGEATVAYEYWREIEQKTEGSYWTGTGRYWYSDADKMAALDEDKRITKFEAGHHYSYNIVLKTNSGYFISDDDTVVSVGDYEWGTPGRSTNLEIKEMSTRLNIYGIYAVDIPKEDTVINGVSVVGVNKELSASTPVTFTARPSELCSGLFDVVEEAWEAAAPLNDIIKSTDATPRAPIAGGEYWYSIVLRAKDGYVFSPDYSDGHHRIKDGSVNFIVDGMGFVNNFHVSDDGKTLTAWEFMSPVTVSSHTHNYSSDWNADANFHWHECDCGEVSDKAEHTLKWVTDKEATAADNGYKHSECTVCGYKSAPVEIPVTAEETEQTEKKANAENKPADSKVENSNQQPKSTSPKTGNDSISLALLSAALTLGGGAVIAFSCKRKRSE